MKKISFRPVSQTGYKPATKMLPKGTIATTNNRQAAKIQTGDKNVPKGTIATTNNRQAAKYKPATKMLPKRTIEFDLPTNCL